MIVEKPILEKYLSLRTEMTGIFDDILMPRIREICLRLHRFDPQKAYVTKPYISVENRNDYDSAYSIPSELLSDENWETWIDDYLEKRRLRYEKEHQQLTERANREVEARERAELARLLVKYPEVAQKT